MSEMDLINLKIRFDQQWRDNSSYLLLNEFVVLDEHVCMDHLCWSA